MAVDEAIGIQRANGWPAFISIQNLYNLLNREEEREMLPLCLSEGVGANPWSPLARGRLTRPWSDEPTTERAKTDTFARELFERTAAIDKPVIDRLTEVAQERELPASQIALAWGSASSIAGLPFRKQIAVSRSLLFWLFLQRNISRADNDNWKYDDHRCP